MDRHPRAAEPSRRGGLRHGPEARPDPDGPPRVGNAPTLAAMNGWIAARSRRPTRPPAIPRGARPPTRDGIADMGGAAAWTGCADPAPRAGIKVGANAPRLGQGAWASAACSAGRSGHRAGPGRVEPGTRRCGPHARNRPPASGVRPSASSPPVMPSERLRTSEAPSVTASPALPDRGPHPAGERLTPAPADPAHGVHDGDVGHDEERPGAPMATSRPPPGRRAGPTTSGRRSRG